MFNEANNIFNSKYHKVKKIILLGDVCDVLRWMNDKMTSFCLMQYDNYEILISVKILRSYLE